ncbi:MAG: hypothetical protein KGD64_12480 [Candidatus Heimdallarchaeota archaeon]|nr:hypothetical protein [Candidatus Heimdallarchaeota archaeon]
MKENITQFLDKEYLETIRIHQLRPLFERYINLNSDLVHQFEQEYSRPRNLIVSALYAADYIVTSSEVKFELEDDARRKEIIEFYINLNITNDEMWYELTYIVAFSYRIASMLRKRYYYLMDRGVAKQIAAALVADYFVRHYIEYSSDKMNIIPSWWIVFLIETAMCQNIFSTTQKKWINSQEILHSKEEGLLAQIIANNFISETEGEPNPAVPIPYFKESSIFYYANWSQDTAKKDRFESLLPARATAQILKEFKKCVPLMDSNNPHILKYMRLAGRYTTTLPEINFIITNSQTTDAEGWIGLLTPLDDINMKEIESLLELKLKDLKSFEKFSKYLPTVQVLEREKEERVVVEEKIEKEEKGFFKRLFSGFKKKKQPEMVKAVKTPQAIDKWYRLILDELLIASVSGIGLGLEIYDTYREDNFTISGLIESEQKDTKPTIFYSEETVAFPSEFLDPIIGLVEVGKAFITAFKKVETLSVVPEEAFYLDKHDAGLYRLVEFVFGENLLVGILAEKQAQTAMTLARSEPKYQRRSLQRKANEFLHARRVNKTDDVGKRTLSREINWDTVKLSYEEKPLFFKKT